MKNELREFEVRTELDKALLLGTLPGKRNRPSEVLTFQEKVIVQNLQIESSFDTTHAKQSRDTTPMRSKRRKRIGPVDIGLGMIVDTDHNL